jgi:hypothetical protein
MFVQTLVGLATLLAVAPAEPQEGSWLAWHGCWRTIGEDTPEQVICMLPGASATEVRLRIIDQGSVIEQAVVRTDGAPHRVQEGGCSGTETGRWSSDGLRVFIRAELDCEGVSRVSTAVLAMVAENEWVDVQTVTVAGNHSTRTRRYRAITGASVPADILAALDDGRQLVRESARVNVSAPLQIDDVIEVTSHLPAPGVEALLAARQHGFGLDARRLVQLEQAGVPTSVIDVMVALSYPSRFAVRDPDVQAPRQPTYGPGTVGWVDDCYDPFWDYYGWRSGMRYGSCYDRYGYGWRSRYGSWNDSYYGWRGGGPVVVIVRPEPDPGAPTTSGRAVKGRGYTRGSGDTDRGPAAPRSTAGSSDRGGSTGSTSAGSSTSSGSGSTSSSSGRKAVRRGGGS